jgi:hypothetical protein
MCEKPTNTTIIHSVYWLCMVAPTCFGITLPSSGSIPSAFWEMLNWGAVDRTLWMGVLCPVTWCTCTEAMLWCSIFRLFSQHIFPDIKRLQEMLVQAVPIELMTHNSIHIKSNTSNHQQHTQDFFFGGGGGKVGLHLGLMLQALCAPLLVPSVNSTGAPRHAGVRVLY